MSGEKVKRASQRPGAEQCHTAVVVGRAERAQKLERMVSFPCSSARHNSCTPLVISGFEARRLEARRLQPRELPGSQTTPLAPEALMPDLKFIVKSSSRFPADYSVQLD